MATTLAAPPGLPQLDAQNGQRKRRKRTAATGAAADCFTCTNRKVNCDRRRPYCSQCLEIGQDCSGYKTQLTWGVGVASRGKLRGLSLPVAGTAKVDPSDTPPKPKKRRESAVSPTEDAEFIRPKLPTISVPSPSIYAPSRESTGQGTPMSWPRHATPLETQWTMTDHGNDIPVTMCQSYPTNTLKTSREAFQSELYTQAARRDSVLSGNYFPQQETVTSPTFQGVHNGMASLQFSPNPVAYANQMSVNPISPPLQSPVRTTFATSPTYTTHIQTPNVFSEVQGLAIRDPVLTNPLSHAIIEEEFDDEVKREDLDECAVTDDALWPSAPFPIDINFPLVPITSGSRIGKTPRMQYLVDYYAEVISPVIVAFDNANNPFRSQVLKLAVHSETLQHAISALSASNLRQRKAGLYCSGRTAPVRRASMARLTLTTSHGALTPEEQIREESYHKRCAVAQLNQQLADPELRKNDSILATLLILCFFHACDSGIAKFQTQFAGVRKLLKLRGEDVGGGTGESSWIARMFTWFDALAATVNDREGQLSGTHLDEDFMFGDWSLENLAGVDKRLFRSIAKLGRLNVLSQGRNVESSPLIVSRPMPSPPMPISHPLFGAEFLDGNGWMRVAADDDLFSAKSSPETAPIHDQHTQFWREWHDIRQELQSWQLAPDTNRPSHSGLYNGETPTATLSLNAAQISDLNHISNAFRYSALLYTERLAHPTKPSSDPDIQQYVRDAIHHIKKVQSDVYLLWPLFITGTECVDDEGRNVIRWRCRDIQTDSGFANNASCLELLEKVWRKHDEALEAEEYAGDLSKLHGQMRNPFRFRDVMLDEANEGEYIVA